MDCKDSIHALEEQIREHEKAIIQLKRARNPLLNVSKLPLEVLGKIFHWNVTFKGHFDGLDEGSHNFLLVCHHWFEVASRTPDLWSFWGNTPKDWARWCHRSGTAPLDLVLNGDDRDDSYLDTTLCNILRDRATRYTIRRVHLKAKDLVLLSSIVAQLTANREELQFNNIESFILWNQREDTPVDVSDFFTRYLSQKLRYLDLFNCAISLPWWDYLTSRTSVLTTLFLDLIPPSPTPTTSQLLSILSSNQTLRNVVLIGCAIPNDGSGGSSFRVQLHHLKELCLEGGLRHIIGLLHQLDYPRNMNLTLELHDCGVADISQTIGPYLRDHLQRHDRPRNGLHLFVSSGPIANDTQSIILHVGDAGRDNFSAPVWIGANAFVEVDVLLKLPSSDVSGRTILDFITHVPREEVVYFQTYYDPVPMEDIPTQFPNVKVLSLSTIPLLAAFPSQNIVGDGRIFPSLERVLLRDVIVITATGVHS